MKRLIKKSEFFDSVQQRGSFGTLIEFFKNPTDKEIQICKKDSEYNAVRGVILNDGTEFCWRGDILHDQLKENNVSFVDIDQFRFAVESGSWIFDSHHKFTTLEVCKMIIKYENKLSKYSSLNNEIYVYYTSDRPEDDNIFYNIDKVKDFVNKYSEVKSNEEID